MDRAGQISETFNSVRDVVLEKNKRYGDSVLVPLGIFANDARMGSIEIDAAEKGILVRLDDKLGRVRNSDTIRANDIHDLMGYLGLLCIKKGYEDASEEID